METATPPEVQEKPKLSMFEIQDMIFSVLSNSDIQYETIEEEDEKKAFSDYVASLLEELGIREAEKADAYAYAIRLAETRASFFKQEEELMRQKRQVIERRIKSMKENISFVMDKFGLKKIAGDRYSISLSHSEAVVVTCPAETLPEEFRTEKVEYSPKKKELKEAIKTGVEIPGVSIEPHTSITIR